MRLLPDVHGGHVPAAVAAEDNAIGQNGRCPAGPAEHLRPRGRLEARRCRRRHDEFSHTTERDDFAVGNNRRAGAKTRLGPLLRARGKVETLE